MGSQFGIGDPNKSEISGADSKQVSLVRTLATSLSGSDGSIKLMHILGSNISSTQEKNTRNSQRLLKSIFRFL